jgi:thiol-disulfide isomerase/thioredoxin
MNASPDPSGKSTAARRSWWRNEWVIMLAVLAVLHATGTLVHVQAFLQRGLLATGIFSTDLVPESGRTTLPPGMSFTDAAGRVVQLDDLRGEVLFVNLWASWCAPCLAEMPAIDRLYATHGDRVRFFLVTLDEDPELGFGHAERSGFSFPVYRPGSAIPRAVYGGVIPTTLVVDTEGRVAVRHEGMARYDSRRFRAILDELAPGAP